MRRIERHGSTTEIVVSPVRVRVSPCASPGLAMRHGDRIHESEGPVMPARRLKRDPFEIGSEWLQTTPGGGEGRWGRGEGPRRAIPRRDRPLAVVWRVVVVHADLLTDDESRQGRDERREDVRDPRR